MGKLMYMDKQYAGILPWKTSYPASGNNIPVNADPDGNLFVTIPSQSDITGNFATIEASPAVANHSVGEYIFWDNQLYKVISAITAGQSLVINSNIQAVNVGSQLTSLSATDSSLQTQINNVSSARHVMVASKSVAITTKSTWYGSNSANVAVSGWTPIGVVGWSPHQTRIAMTGVSISGNTLTVTLAATDGGNIPSGTWWCAVLYTN